MRPYDYLMRRRIASSELVRQTTLGLLRANSGLINLEAENSGKFVAY